jgi:hypothetical protein
MAMLEGVTLTLLPTELICNYLKFLKLNKKINLNSMHGKNIVYAATPNYNNITTQTIKHTLIVTVSSDMNKDVYTRLQKNINRINSFIIKFNKRNNINIKLPLLDDNNSTHNNKELNKINSKKTIAFILLEVI